MHEPPDTRCSLIVKLRDPADSASWREFVATYEPLVYRLARRKGLQDADARDLCQEVFQAVARGIDRWEPGRGSFRGWLSRIARNLLINALTRGKLQPRGSGRTSIHELLEARPAGDASESARFQAEYRRCLFQLAAEEVRAEFTPTTWRAFWQTAMEARSPDEVAGELGLTMGAVYVARSRVLARLKARIARLEDEATAERNEVHHDSPARPL
jgi:RNA polymerase sigma-70 factor (ECF subfamily)